MKAIEVQVTSDFIYPWCWIGQHHLRLAIEQAGLTVPVRVRYLPFELNPDMPVGGVSRQAYRTQKFGSWARAQARDAEVAQVGRASGAEFNYDRVKITPNTRMAHRMMYFADAHGEAAQIALLHEAVYAAYFREGRDIGSIDVLVEIACAGGFDGEAAREYLISGLGESEVIAAEQEAHAAGVHGVPHFVIGLHHISGAQPPAFIAQALVSCAQSQKATA
jgi:predicted DsbA family dithiol-disulfide isomerase